MAYLDPANQKFVESLAGGQPLYEKSFVDARQVLEDIQGFKPAPDVSQERFHRGQWRTCRNGHFPPGPGHRNPEYDFLYTWWWMDLGEVRI